MISHVTSHMIGHMISHVTSHRIGHMTSHMISHMTRQVTLPMISLIAISFPLSCPTNSNSCFTVSVAELLKGVRKVPCQGVPSYTHNQSVNFEPKSPTACNMCTYDISTFNVYYIIIC